MSVRFTLWLFGLLIALPSAALAEPKAPEVLFTFDDGPALGKTPIVLDLLDQHHIKAIFFVNGWHFQGTRPAALKEQALLREIQRRGHAVGNHTIHHDFLCGHYYIKHAAEEVEGNADLIEQAIGVRPDLFRTPYGSHCKVLNETLGALGIRPIGWDIDPQDWKTKDAKKIQTFVIAHLNKLHGRAILLMHDVQGATVKALPAILDWLDEENARRIAANEIPIKVLDYSYLVPPHPAVPPVLQGIGRMLFEMIKPAAAPLAWLAPKV